MSKVLIATLVVSLVAPVAGLAIAQALSGPPQTGSMGPPDLNGSFQTPIPVLPDQPNPFLETPVGARPAPSTTAAQSLARPDGVVGIGR
jgi:hypothetical protein